MLRLRFVFVFRIDRARGSAQTRWPGKTVEQERIKCYTSTVITV